jgi:hypothetical protein
VGDEKKRKPEANPGFFYAHTGEKPHLQMPIAGMGKV